MCVPVLRGTESSRSPSLATTATSGEQASATTTPSSLHLLLGCPSNSTTSAFSLTFPSWLSIFPWLRANAQYKTGSKGPVFRARGYEHLIGSTTPGPGRIFDLAGDAPAVEIHATVRIRGYGRTPSDPAVPGYKLNTGCGKWVRSPEVAAPFSDWGRRSLTLPQLVFRLIQEPLLSPKAATWFFLCELQPNTPGSFTRCLLLPSHLLVGASFRTDFFSVGVGGGGHAAGGY